MLPYGVERSGLLLSGVTLSGSAKLILVGSALSVAVACNPPMVNAGGLPARGMPSVCATKTFTPALGLVEITVTVRETVVRGLMSISRNGAQAAPPVTGKVALPPAMAQVGVCVLEVTPSMMRKCEGAPRSGVVFS